MAIRVICGSCGSKIDAKDELRGQTRRCPKCRQPILIEPAAPQPRPAQPRPVQSQTAQPQAVRPAQPRPVQSQTAQPQAVRPAQPRPVQSQTAQPQAVRPAQPRPVQSQTAQPQAVRPAQAASRSATGAASPAAEGLKMRRLRPDDLYFVVGSDKLVAYWKSGEGWMLNVGNGFSQVKRSPGLIPDLGEFVLAEGRVAQTDNGRRLKGLRFWSLTGRGVLLALGRAETEILEKAQFPTVPSGSQKRFILDQIRKLYFRDFTDDALEIVEFLTSFDSHSQSVGTFDD